MAYDFSGKRALVTGGARGIGKEIVKRLVKCNAQVTVLDINKENLDKLKHEIPSVHTVPVDLTDWAATRRAVEELGVIDMLANNVGVTKKSTFEELTEEAFDSLFAVNVKPMVNISQAFVKALKKHGKEGAIVNTSSLTSPIYFSSLAGYSASKAAIDKLTKIMAVELAPYRIRVNAVNPTIVITDYVKSLITNEEIQKMVDAVPLKKAAEAEDVAAAVAFLLSEEAKMITGTCLPVDGGQAVA